MKTALHAPLLPESVTALLVEHGLDTPCLVRWAREVDRQAAIGRSTAQPLDCFRLLAELAAAGVNNAAVARKLGKRRSTITRWKAGSEPSYSMGCSLVALHAAVTSKVRQTQRTGAHTSEHEQENSDRLEH